MPASSTDPLLFGVASVNLNTTLRNLPLPPPVVVDPAMPARDALRLIDARGGEVAVGVDTATSVPLGIVTLRDAVRSIIDEDSDLAGPIAGLMTGGLASLSVEATVHHATVLMLRRGMRHLILTGADGRLFNVVSQGDLYGLHAADSASLANAILASRSIAELAARTLAVRHFAARRLAEGSGAAALCEWVSALNDLIALQVIDLVEGEFDLPYVPWCWVVFGSEGRLEQTLVTDQDNGIVFAAASAVEAEELRQRFLPFAGAVNAALDECGIQLCKGQIMAGNPAWCLSLDEWKRCFGSWIAVPEPKALLNASIFFDFRPLYGREELVTELQRWLLQRIKGNMAFLRAMTVNALMQGPPLSWWRDFHVGGDKNHPHTLDLKGQGIRVFVDAIRVFALAQGIEQTNTIERLRGARQVLGMPAEEVAAMTAAFYQIQRLRLQNQVSGEYPAAANRLNPDRLHRLDRQILKEAFRQARTLQQRLRLDYLN
ncbi:MAG: CBS domain-containing protein [Betaproteobacteria bacterium]|nr:CBS domain-containing protein [Betaproteobacteria bacterium]